ncbi:dihydropteroate synthase [Oceanicoccus sp. KOV_DT_Chl]|uniref:dihydropteroate synthase n=1 Tax=Oceanicoccus sp. KOV_DT_Chl TaxID=1904639 RepID=UPI003510C23D
MHQAGELNIDMALFRCEQMLQEGAAIIDVGGESTRPGAEPVGVQQELDRVLPIVNAIHKRFDTIISIDTSSPELMLEAAKVGAGLLNDVRALSRPGAIEAAAATGLPVCLMHMQGQPQTMQQQPDYGNVVREVIDYLLARVASCEQAGIERSQLILDPGFGFGKSVEHNLVLLNRLPQLVAQGMPVLVGLSRKSLIGKVLGREVDQRLAGSLALALLAAQRGASIIRVHDVQQTVDAISLWAAVDREMVAGSE